MRSLAAALFVLISASISHAQGLAECDFGFDINTQSSAFQSVIVDGEVKRGLWLSINRAPVDVRKLGRFIGRLQICLMTPDGQPRTLVHPNGVTQEITSPFITSCTAALLPGNRLLTNLHCFYEPQLQKLGFSIVYEARVDFGYTSKDATGTVRTYRVLPRELDADEALDAMVLQVIGDANTDLGGHIPMQMKSMLEPYQQLLMIHHPGSEPQQFSTGTCQVHRLQADIADEHSPLRHTCETMGGSSGSLIFDSRSLHVVGLHNQGGLEPGGESYNGGHKIAMVSSSLGLDFQDIDPARPPVETPDPSSLEDDKARDELLFALLIPNPEAKRAALESLLETYPDTPEADKAAELLASLTPPNATPDAPPNAPPKLSASLAERMARDADVQDCDRLAGSPRHPDKDANLMRQDGISFRRINHERAVAACERALETFPDHPRMLAHLGRALDSGGNDQLAVSFYLKAAEQGDAVAQDNLAYMYEHGEGVAESLGTAVRWYQAAAEQGFAPAQHSLGWMYENGLGIAQSYESAVEWYLKGAEQEYHRAQNNLGVLYENGWGVPQSYDLAVSYYRQAAEQDHGLAQANLGLMYELGRGVPQSDETAISWYRKSAAEGNANGQNSLGWMYKNGRGVTQSYATALKWYREAVDQDHARAQSNLGDMYFFGRGVGQSDTTAVEWYRKSAEQGNEWGQYNLGWMYEKGRGVEQSDTIAAGWYRKSAEQGNASAQNSLAIQYLNGRGVKQSDAVAVSWYRKAAEQGNNHGQNNLGDMYFDGRGGLPQSDETALEWYRKSAAQDNYRAQNNIGWMYENGRGVEKSNETAVEWYTKAAEQGYATAQSNLGGMYLHGRGVAQSRKAAVKWYRLAAEQGHEGAQEKLAELLK